MGRTMSKKLGCESVDENFYGFNRNECRAMFKWQFPRNIYQSRLRVVSEDLKSEAVSVACGSTDGDGVYENESGGKIYRSS